MNAEKLRLRENAWKNWGPYVSDRQWGTVREDYSSNGDGWSYNSVFGDDEKLQSGPPFNDHILCHQYFHEDNGKGLVASHQTGWAGLIIRYLFDSKA